MNLIVILIGLSGCDLIASLAPTDDKNLVSIPIAIVFYTSLIITIVGLFI